MSDARRSERETTQREADLHRERLASILRAHPHHSHVELRTRDLVRS